MAFAISNAFRYPLPQIRDRSSHLTLRTAKSPSFVRLLPGRVSQSRIVIRAASSATGNPQSDGDFNPYEVLGVNPIEGFDKIKQTYGRKLKDAQRSGDETTAALLEKAYDKLMYSQLMDRKKGVTFGSFKVSKDIKYADKQPMIPWGPRYSRSSKNDMLINLAISAVFSAWIAIKRNVEYKPLQFMSFVFVYRIFDKLKSFEAPSSPTYNEEGEENGRGLRMGYHIHVLHLQKYAKCVGVKRDFRLVVRGAARNMVKILNGSDNEVLIIKSVTHRDFNEMIKTIPNPVTFLRQGKGIAHYKEGHTTNC